MFLSSGGRNESNRHYLVLNCEVKIFLESDLHQVYTGGIKRFWAQEAKMSLIAISLFES